ncbi:MATE family efflux transporter [Shewanella marina]|uniref:MATE family efflux transporter n=1 Tax=Shewanella marina TaxID=487319 RepID=UPI0004729242|nr:MATE family efflux transporter [Shewanella marina]
MKDRHGLLTQPIGRVLLNMSLPNLIGILTILAFNLVDTFFISKLGTDALTSISFTFPVTLVVSSIAIGIGAGVATRLGRLIGGGHAQQAKVFLGDSLLLTVLMVSAIAIIGSLCIKPLFLLLGAEPSHIPLIRQYMSIWFLGVPLLVLLMVGNQGLRATGNTRAPAAIMSLAAIINLILDPLLIFGIGPFPQLGIQGAAIATVISWLTAFLLSAYLLLLKHKMLQFGSIDLSRYRENWKQLAHIAQPATLMNLINPLANAAIMALLARMDHDAVAAFGAGTRIESIMLIVVMALSSSLVPFVAQNLGAGQQYRARQALLYSVSFVLIFQTVLYLPLAYFAEPIAHLFSQDANVIEWLSFYILVLPIAYGPLGVVILVATSLNAYHRPMASLLLNVARLFGLMLPLAAAGAYFFGVAGVFVALPISNAIAGIACLIIAKSITEPSNATDDIVPMTEQ